MSGAVRGHAEARGQATRHKKLALFIIASQTLRELHGSFKWCFWTDNQKFFAAPAPRDIAGSQCGAQAFRGLDENGISCGVAMRVVDRFKMINIQQDDR